MAAVTLHSDFEAQEYEVCHCFHCFLNYLHGVMGLDAIISVFWMLSFKPAFSLVTFPGDFIPQVGKSVVGLTTLEQCGNFFGIIVLQFMGCLLGSSIVRLMTISFKRTYATCLASQDCCCQSPCPCCRPLLTCASSGDTRTLKGWSGSVSCGGQCSFLWVLMHTRFCLYAPNISGGYGVWFEKLLHACSCLVVASPLPLDMGYLFLVGSNIVLQLVAILVFSQENVLLFSHILFCHPLCSSSRVIICLSIY